mmetsp:Transcript_68627/g.151081  ORF Transcript_68627/g.151081 Transcript_68627/m.151081 type:complete len:211 (+) Transcript_68627:912-1544(+)
MCVCCGFCNCHSSCCKGSFRHPLLFSGSGNCIARCGQFLCHLPIFPGCAWISIHPAYMQSASLLLLLLFGIFPFLQKIQINGLQHASPWPWPQKAEKLLCGGCIIAHLSRAFNELININHAGLVQIQDIGKSILNGAILTGTEIAEFVQSMGSNWVQVVKTQGATLIHIQVEPKASRILPRAHLAHGSHKFTKFQFASTIFVQCDAPGSN